MGEVIQFPKKNPSSLYENPYYDYPPHFKANKYVVVDAREYEELRDSYIKVSEMLNKVECVLTDILEDEL